jgi:hypothetical protein
MLTVVYWHETGAAGVTQMSISVIDLGRLSQNRRKRLFLVDRTGEG